MKKEQEKKTQERYLPERKVYPFDEGRELFSPSLSSSRLLEGPKALLEAHTPIIVKELIPIILGYLKPIQIQISVFVDPEKQAQFAKQLEDKEKKTKETTEFQTPQEALRLASLVSDNSIPEQASILALYCQQAERTVRRSISADRNPNIILAALQAFSIIAQGQQEFKNREEFFLYNTSIPAGTRLYAINLIMVLFRGNHFQGLRHMEIPSSYRGIFEKPEEVLAFETFIQYVELRNDCLSSVRYTFHITTKVVDMLSGHFYRRFTSPSYTNTRSGEVIFHKGDEETPRRLTKMLPFFSIYPSQQCSRGRSYEVTLDAQDYTQMDTIRLKETLAMTTDLFDRYRDGFNTLLYGESVSKVQIEAHRQLDVIISSISPSNSQSKIQELSQCIAGLKKNDKLMSILSKDFKQMLEEIQTKIDPYLSLYLKESTCFTTNSTVPSLRA